MSDLISRADAIEAVALEIAYKFDISTYDAREIATHALSALPSADAVQGWIPVGERLPKDNKEVLISCEWGVDIGEHSHDGWRSEWINHYDDDTVLAWMPLPAPYKGGDDE